MSTPVHLVERLTGGVGRPVQDLNGRSGGLQALAAVVVAAFDAVEVEVPAEGRVGGEPAGVGPQGGMAGDALDGGGVQVIAVHGVELDQRGPQLDVGGGDFVTDQVGTADQPAVEGAEGVQQCGQGEVTF